MNAAADRSITHAFESVRDLWNIRDGIGCGFAMDKGGSGEKDGHGVRTGKEKEKDAQPDSGEPQLLRQGERCSLCQDREEIWNLAMNLLEVARLKFAGGSGDSEGGGDEGTVDLACGISSVLRCLESVGVMMKPAGAVKGVDVKVVDSRPYLAEKFGTLEGIAWFDETRLSQYTRGGGSVTVLLSDRVLSEEQRQGAPLTGDIEGEGGKEPAEMMIPFDPLKNEEAEALISAAGLMIGEPRRLVIEIRDTGRGIPQNKMRRVLGDITKKVGFPPKRTLSYDEPEVAAVNVVALVGGPLPKGTNAPPIEEARAVLLLTDMQMGDMSGLALGRQVRKEAVEAGAIVGPFPPPPARSASQELSQLKGEVSPLGYAAPPLYPGDPRMGGMGEFVCSFSRTDSGGSRLLDPQARHSKRASGVSVDGRSPTIIEFERDVSPASAGAGPLNRDTSGSPPTSSARKKRVPPDSELPELRIRAASIPSPKTPMQTAGAEVQWAVRVSAPASPQPCVLRCCLLSAQIRGGILERHPEAETVMDAVLEKPLYADGLIQQLRELAAAVLWTGRKRKTGASAEDVEVELH
uniref:Uncharacterized protein n=1 Tax=Chromera velia CCMP2878 TaxID=1169474 RepID=A0A0G4GKB0_9ALVE|eukprot:Cvel_22280.t1-p1 / transcript=Cvel_22280.t1 / gene=Cvel_22280 / organism=Chromera_velia_CCMP2878 / gene_product=hypothetical protein / transcript_product=hypothetical protein / location=Cvel_scaffold2175:5969-14763(+) / protein_length=576 / sequence_SO=supercontig / SO=protein_coding / is_pseudo=false